MKKVKSYIPDRDHRWQYSHQAIDHIQARNCALGCKVPDPKDVDQYGPGGSCGILAWVAIGDANPIKELQDDGTNITCLAREPLDEEEE